MHSKQMLISVPFRGLIFLNNTTKKATINTSSDFRPLPGSYISKSVTGPQQILIIVLFPSPSGVLYF